MAKIFYSDLDFLIDKEIPNRSIPKSKSDIDLKRPLCSRLFARKSVQDKIEELKSRLYNSANDKIATDIDIINYNTWLKSKNNPDSN